MEGPSGAYDVIVLGTGLTESIFACAAAKLGKKVLHLDTADSYGGENQSMGFDQFALETTDLFRKQIGKKIDDCSSQCTEWGSTVVDVSCKDIEVKSLRDEVVNCRYKHSKNVHPSCFGYLMQKLPQRAITENASTDNSHPVFRGYSLDHGNSTIGRAMHNSRKYCVDRVCSLVYCNGDAVNAMLLAGVDNYLEFNLVEQLYYYKNSSEGGGTMNHQLNATKVRPLHQWTIPCSKADIFTSTLLPNTSKRALMKFMQFTSDWGRVHVDGLDDVLQLNELELGLGRSLQRPQNKRQQQDGAFSSGASPAPSAVDTTGARVGDGDLHGLHPLRKISFVEYMQQTPHQLPLDLQCIIYYALCLQAEPISSNIGAEAQSRNEVSVAAPLAWKLSAFDGLSNLYNHIKSLNRFAASGGSSKTAFLYPIYGVGEIAQAFCRMCAVWGGTYMLRTRLQSVGEVEERDGGIEASSLPNSDNPSVESCGGALLQCTTNATQRIVLGDSEGHRFSCANLICNSTLWNSWDTPLKEGFNVRCLPSEPPQFFLARRVSVVDSEVLKAVMDGKATGVVQDSNRQTCQAAPEHRHCIGVIPPGTISLFVRWSADGTSVGLAHSPGGLGVVSYTHQYSIHIVQIASKAHTVPEDNVLIYYSTTINRKLFVMGDDSLSPNDASVKSMTALLMNSVVERLQATTDPKFNELFYATTLKGMDLATSRHPCISVSGRASIQQTVDINAYFEEAKQLFSDIYPNAKFMEQTPSNTVAAADDGQSDDDSVAKDSASVECDEANVQGSTEVTSSKKPHLDEETDFLLATLEALDEVA